MVNTHKSIEAPEQLTDADWETVSGGNVVTFILGWAAEKVLDTLIDPGPLPTKEQILKHYKDMPKRMFGA